jgi:hypothetical protein
MVIIINLNMKQTSNLSVPDPPERNLGDAGFLNPKAKKINLGTERCCCCAAQTVSASRFNRELHKMKGVPQFPKTNCEHAKA